MKTSLLVVVLFLSLSRKLYSNGNLCWLKNPENLKKKIKITRTPSTKHHCNFVINAYGQRATSLPIKAGL